MNNKRSPRACFKVAPDSKMNDGDELLSVLERALSARFDSVRVIEMRFFREYELYHFKQVKSHSLCLLFATDSIMMNGF